MKIFFRKQVSPYTTSRERHVTEPDYLPDECAIALMLGFGPYYTAEELPAGFRNAWKDAKEKGFFHDAQTIGDLLNGYCRYQQSQ